MGGRRMGGQMGRFTIFGNWETSPLSPVFRAGFSSSPVFRLGLKIEVRAAHPFAQSAHEWGTWLSRHYRGSIDHSCPWGIGVWNLLPAVAKNVAGQRRACAIQMMCRIRNSGTANVGM
jgi:hypothetical protein